MSIISVVVPVYKVEKYISRCVESILAQSFQNIELILVDDGSPDSCPSICDEYGKYENVHVIHRENGGLSAARNSGIEWVLKNSTSEWITFVDSDDWIHPQMLEILYKAAVDRKTKMAVCNHKYTEMQEVYSHIATANSVKMSAEDFKVNIGLDYAWGKLYHISLFESLRYPEGKLFEDTFTTYKALFESGNVARVNETLYYYFKNSEGISHSIWTEGSLDCIEGIRQQIQFYESHGYEKALSKEKALLVEQYAYQIHRILQDNTNDPDGKYLREFRKTMLEEINKNDQISLNDRFYWYEAIHPKLADIKKNKDRVVRFVKRKLK